MMGKLKSGNRHENMTIRKVDLKTRNGKINLHWTRKTILLLIEGGTPLLAIHKYSPTWALE